MASTPLRTVPDLTGLLKHAGHVLETQLTAALAEIGLTPRMQCVLINALEEERTQIQLAEIAYLDKTTMVVTVDALEKAGFAERKPSATDRRARIIAVTKAGAEVAEEGQRIVDRVHAEALAALAAPQRKPFAESLAHLVDDQLATPVEAQPVRRSRQRAN
jgi:MarR family transcriptional regulator for hemolysin